jgi:hypothetical protein
MKLEQKAARNTNELRAQTVRFAMRRFTWHGILLAFVIAGLVLISTDTPLHQAAPVAGPVLGLLGIYLLARTAIYGGVALQTWLLGRIGDRPRN